MVQIVIPNFEITPHGGVQTVHPQSRRVLQKRAATATTVVQVLALGEGVVVREEYFRHADGVSNVYFLDAHLREQWRAELPSPDDVYSGPIQVCSGVLRVASWKCWTCDLDPANGRLVAKKFTK